MTRGGDQAVNWPRTWPPPTNRGSAPESWHQIQSSSSMHFLSVLAWLIIMTISVRPPCAMLARPHFLFQLLVLKVLGHQILKLRNNQYCPPQQERYWSWLVSQIWSISGKGIISLVMFDVRWHIVNEHRWFYILAVIKIEGFLHGKTHELWLSLVTQ